MQEAIQESLAEWAELEKSIESRRKKDMRIISMYCAQNNKADILHTLDLLEKYGGLPEHDGETVKSFKEKYPHNLSVQLIADFTDVQEIYRSYLESGGMNQ